jgi:hypothetical protein
MGVADRGGKVHALFDDKRAGRAYNRNGHAVGNAGQRMFHQFIGEWISMR